ncbi:MAG: TonB-dependent receptor plug domain-containing protein, partial [Syntrophothermus sp.]
EMISVLEFYKGGFPSEYGGRLSSIANVVSKDGNKNNYSGSLNASFISGKAMLEGPIPHGSFIITGRKSYFSEVLKNYFNDKKAPFNFYDLSFKVNYSNPDFNNGKIILHGFISRDDLNNNDPKSEDYFVANKLFGLNWYQIWGSPLMSNFSLSYSQYGAQVFPNLSTAKPRRNSVDDVSMNFDFTYMYQSKDELHFGLQNTFLSTDLILQNLYGANTNIASNGTMIKGYVNYKLYRYDNWGFDIGARMNFFSASKRRPFLFEPRINIIFRPMHTLSLKAAIGRFSQEIVSLTNENELISIFEPWTIVPSYLDPPEATHFILGAEYYLNESFSMQVEGYYKLLSSLFDLNPRKFSARDYDYINISGRAYGIEGLIKYQFGSVYVQSSYTLSWAFKENRDIVTIPRYDVRHSINILAGISLGAGWEVNFNWSFNSGMPFRPIAGYYDRLMINPWESNYLFGDYVPVTYWSETNNKRLPYYHRLDLSISKDFRISKADVSLGASIINAYNQKNVFYFNKDSGEKVYMLPFFPSATLKVKI